MTTVNDFADILRIIREQPEWGDALRSALLSKELLEMPQTLAEFVKATNQRLAALEEDVAELKAGQARLEEGQARLEERQIRLEERQIRLEERQIRLEERQIRLEEGQARLEESHVRLERSFAKLDGDVGNLKGDAYELKVGNHIQSIIGQHTDIMPIRVLKGSRAPNDMEFLNPIYEAKRKGLITERERIDAFAVDIVMEGRREADDATVFIVAEVSRTIGDSDVNRALDRANIVQRATGKQAIPAVIGVFVDQVRRELAEEQNVAVITYGEQ